MNIIVSGAGLKKEVPSLSVRDGCERDVGENLRAVTLNRFLTFKPPTLSPLEPYFLILLLALHKSYKMSLRSKIFGDMPVGPINIHLFQ